MLSITPYPVSFDTYHSVCYRKSGGLSIKAGKTVFLPTRNIYLYYKLVISHYEAIYDPVIICIYFLLLDELDTCGGYRINLRRKEDLALKEFLRYVYR